MPIKPENIVRHELIGLEVEVSRSSNPSQIGIKGRVIDETQKTIKIETTKGEKILAKENLILIFTIPDGRKVEVDGKLLVGRPEDRIKKKLPRW